MTRPRDPARWRWAPGSSGSTIVISVPSGWIPIHGPRRTSHPSDRLVVAESGIASRETVARLRPHADAFLVGSALMGAPDLDRAVRELVYGRTKTCGLTSAADAARAGEAGATHGGLMFAAGSPRRIPLRRRGGFGAPLSWVGVFADQPPGGIAAAAADLGLDAVQLHGHETAEQTATVRRQVPAATAVWKAERVQERIPKRGLADRLVLDGWTAGRLGGTGRRSTGHYWSNSSSERVFSREDFYWAVAAAALDTWALDASSGVESAPGRKDPGLLRAFFTQRRRLPGRGDSPNETRRPLRSIRRRLRPRDPDSRAGAARDSLSGVEGRSRLHRRALRAAARLCRATDTVVLLPQPDGRLPARSSSGRISHGGAHKTNQALGQGLLARRMGKRRLIAETGAGQHGVATALTGAVLGLATRVYMGAVDMERQKPNVFRMQLMGAEVVPVTTGSRTLKDAINEALRDGRRATRIPTISSAPSPVHTRSRSWCGIFSASSETRPGGRCRRRKGPCPTW